MIAEHPRCYDRGQQIEKEEHVKELTKRKHQARLHRGQNRLTRAVKSANDFLCKAAEHQYNLGSVTAQLIKLLDRYGADELNIAMLAAIDAGVPHPNTVSLNLDRWREKNNQLPPVPISVSMDPRVCELTVSTHDLNNYDQLQSFNEEICDDK